MWITIGIISVLVITLALPFLGVAYELKRLLKGLSDKIKDEEI